MTEESLVASKRLRNASNSLLEEVVVKAAVFARDDGLELAQVNSMRD
jgi:hypothetical protein